MVSEIRSGPVFPGMISAINYNQRGLSASRVTKWLGNLCTDVFGPDHGFTTHSMRRTAARWAAISNATEAEIMRCGRWTSIVYGTYVEDGRACEENMLAMVTGDDSLHKRWLFFPTR
jgi:hypothetical protein